MPEWMWGSVCAILDSATSVAPNSCQNVLVRSAGSAQRSIKSSKDAQIPETHPPQEPLTILTSAQEEQDSLLGEHVKSLCLHPEHGFPLRT